MGSSDPELQIEYALIGEFTVAFEEVMTAIRATIHYLLRHNGLDNRDMELIVTTGLTAEPLRQVYRSMVTAELNNWPQSEQSKTEMKEVLGLICKRLQTLIEMRNIVLHASWEMGSPSIVDNERIPMFGFRMKHAGQGLWGDLAPDTAKFPAVIQFAKTTRDIVDDYYVSLQNPNVLMFRLRVVIEKGRKVLLMPIVTPTNDD